MQLRRNEILTGVLVLATVAVLTAVLITLGAPGLFRRLSTYHLYFDNAAGIKLGAPVLLAGRKVGQVASLYSPVSAAEGQKAVDAFRRAQPADGASPAPSPPQYEARIDVEVDRSAKVYKDARVRMMTLGLLGETAIDITQGNEAAGLADNNDSYAGERVPDFGEAISRVLKVVEPVAKEATETMKQLQVTASNLSQITAPDSQLNLALGQFRTFGEHLVQITAPDSSLSQSLANIQNVSAELTKNNNIEVTLQNFRDSSEKLKGAIGALGPDLQASMRNIRDATDTLRTQPWRLVWPSTKKYDDSSRTGSAESTIVVRKSAKPSANPSPSPGRGRRPWVIVP